MKHPAARMKRLRKSLRRAHAAYRDIAPYGKAHRRYLFRGAVATLFLVAARLAFPWPLRGLLMIVFHKTTGRAQVVIHLIPRRGDPVLWLIGAFVVIILLWGVAESRQRLAFTRYAVGLTSDLRRAVIGRVSEQAALGTAPGDLISTVTGDTSRVKTGIKSILISISRNGAFFLGVAVIVTVIDPLVGIVYLVGGLATVLAGVWGASRSSPIVRRSRKREGVLAGELHRHLAGQTELSSAPPSEGKPDSKVTRVVGLTTFIVHAILAATTCGVLYLTINDGRSGKLSPGAVFTILAYVLLMHNKTVGLGRGIARIGRLQPSAERIASLVRRGPKSPTPTQTSSDPDHPEPGTQALTNEQFTNEEK